MSETSPAAVVILAAGEGTRMKSRTPKVLHTLAGRSMLGHVLAAAAELRPGRLVVVVGQGRDQVIPHIAEQAPDARVVVQPRQLGTGNAVTALTAVVPDPAGYGRIVLDGQGGISEIVEEADATPEQRAIDEINSGVYAFDGDLLADAVKRVATDNAKGEEYLTDVLAILRADGHRAGFVRAGDPAEVQGVNDRVQLARARRLYNERVLRGWMLSGVTIVDPATTWIDAGVTLDGDVEIGPGTQLQGRTVVRAGARIGPGCSLADTTVGPGAVVTHSVCVSARIGAGAVVGPFASLGPGSEVPASEGAQRA